MGAGFAAKAIWIYWIFLGFFLLHGFNIVPYYYLIGRGRPGFVAGVTLASGVAMLVGIPLLAVPFGAVGAAAASIPYALVGWRLAHGAARLTPSPSESLGAMVRGLRVPLAIHVLAAGIALGVGALVPFGAAAGLGASALTCGLILLGAGLWARESHNPYYDTVWAIGRGLLATRRRAPSAG